MNPRPTLRDIAERACVSKATVSLALRNHPRIPSATRGRIQAIAAEVGYLPDPAVARIASHGWSARRESSQEMVAFVTGSMSFEPRRHSSYFHALARVAPKLGYRADEFHLADYRSPERLADVLITRGIRGVLLHQIADEAFVAQFPWREFSTVACSTSIILPPVHVVLLDYVAVMQETWERCAAAGYRRLGIALMKEMNPREALARVGVVEHLSRVSSGGGGPSGQVGHFALNEMGAFVAWAKTGGFDAVVGLNNIFFWALRAAGVRMPDDIGYASLFIGSTEKPDVSGWLAREEVVAKRALEQLDLARRAGEVGPPENPCEVHIRPAWNAGTTLGLSAKARVGA